MVGWILIEMGDVVPETCEKDADLDGPACDEIVEAN